MSTVSSSTFQRLRDLSTARYDRLSAPIQDLLCSAYGIQELVRRRGARMAAQRRMRDIETTHWDREAASVLIRTRLSRILALARSLPGYADKAPPFRMESPLTELESWPILQKEDVRRNGDGYLSRQPGGTDIFSLTSGTSGTPLRVWRPRACFRELFHSSDLFKSWFGVPVGSRRASFTGKMVVPLQSRRVWRINAPGKQLVLSQYHLGPLHVHAYARVLARWRPQVLDGYTSNLVELAKLFSEHNISVRIPLIITTCEVLTSSGRALLENVFQGRVADKYGSSENVAYACECPFGNRHIFQNFGIIEVTDETGRRLPSGTLGRLVLTTLTNDLMPLIRYEVGDLGVIGDASTCPCGRTSPILQGIYGRQDDVIITKDGRRLSIFAFNLLRGLEGVLAMQLVQKDLNSFLVRANLVHNLSVDIKKFEASIHIAFDRLIGSDPTRSVVFEYDDTIERSPGGKIRNVIREF